MKEHIDYDPVDAIVGFLVRAEGGDHVVVGIDYDIVPDTGSVWVNSYTGGKLGWYADEIEALYAENGVTGTVDGVCDGLHFRARLIDGEVRRDKGEIVYPDDLNDPASLAAGAALKFVRGQISEQDALTVLSQARATAK